MEAMMTEYHALRATLQNTLTHLQQRLQKVEQNLRQTPEPDSEERAISRENDDVLERLDKSDREEIRQLQEALARIDAGTYGLCTRCGKSITPARLAALPYASTCITCAR
jgi:DnaK suppressor protein